MTRFFRCYLSDIAILLLCLGFGCYVLSEAFLSRHKAYGWVDTSTQLVLARH